MDYHKAYERLYERAIDRELDEYTEVHHIVPRCIGGDNSKSNLVRLTPEEHFVAHQLLYKMYPHVSGLAFALIAMTGNPHGKRGNKSYGWIRRAVAVATSKLSIELNKDPEYKARHRAAVKAFTSTPEYKAKISAIHKGRKATPQARANIAEAGRNRAPRLFSEEVKQRFSAAQKRRWEGLRGTDKANATVAKIVATRMANGGYLVSEAARAKISAAGKGRVTSDETREKLSAATKGKPKSEETRQRMMLAQRALAAANAKPPPTEQELQERAAQKFANLSARSKGKTLDAGHKQKISAGLSASYQNGRKPARSKLTDEQVREIRLCIQHRSASGAELSRFYGVAQSVISEIRSGKSYQHVK